MITKQQAIDLINKNFTGKAFNIKEFKVQRDPNSKPLINTTNECCYQTEDGRRCAIGCLLPDDHEGLRFNGGFNMLRLHFSDLMDFMPSKDLRLLANFQNLHDEHDGTTEQIKADLIKFCEENF